MITLDVRRGDPEMRRLFGLTVSRVTTACRSRRRPSITILFAILTVLSGEPSAWPATTIESTSVFTDNRINDIFGDNGWRLALGVQVSDPLGIPSNIASAKAVGRNAGDVYFLGFDASEPQLRSFLSFPPYSGQRGIYDFTVVNKQGEVVVASSHNLDKIKRLPGPQNLRVSSLTTTPVFSFDPVEGAGLYDMKIFNAARFLVFVSSQSSTPSFQVPPGVIVEGQSYFLEARALDFDFTEPFIPGQGRLENRSVNFIPFTPGRPIPITPPQTAFLGSSTNRSASFTSEPVNTATGNYFYPQTDLILPGRGLPVVFTRSYNSQDPDLGPLGQGWTHSYNVGLAEGSDGRVSIKLGDGHMEMFGPLADGRYVPLFGGIFASLEKLADGTFSMTLKNQTRYDFDQSGRLTRLSDRNGNFLALQHDAAGKLTLITDTVGRVLTFHYDDAGRLTRLLDPAGRIIFYAYDAEGNLAGASDFLGNFTTFSYDGQHRLVRIINTREDLVVVNAYDTIGRVIRQTNGRGFSTTLAYDTPVAGDTTVTDAVGNRTLYSHDDLFRLIRVIDAAGGVAEFGHDLDSNLIGVRDQNGRITRFTYDGRGNVTSIRDPLGRVHSFTYDNQNNLTTARNARGFTTIFTYDSAGNLTGIEDPRGNVTIFVYDGFGQLIRRTDARGNTTQYAYDSQGNLTGIIDALGVTTTIAYDSIGRLLSLTDPNGHIASAGYDASSRLTQIFDPLGNTTGFSYDPVGNLVQIVDAKGNRMAYGYDAVNNLTTVTDALGRVTLYTYDANNNRIGLTNANGHTTAYTFNPLNRLTRITDPLGNATTYTYDLVGNITAVTDANETTNTFTYDANNRLIGIVYGDGSWVAYTYNRNGSRISMVDSRGTTTYSYDPLDRLVQAVHPTGIVGYGYDQVGNRTSLTYADGRAVSYFNDAVNRLAQVVDREGKLTRYAYDAASNLLNVSYPNGTAVAYRYDAANRLVMVENTRGAQRLSSFAYTLDALGNRIEMTKDGRLVTSYAYDTLSQLVGVARPSGVRTDYAYDPVGNRLAAVGPGQVVQFSYDAADRLLQAGRKLFTYDANGNRIGMNDGVVTQYAYDAANRLIRVSRGDLVSTYEYDGDGNKVGQTLGSERRRFTNDVATALPVILAESGPAGDRAYAYGLSLITQTASDFQHFYHYDGLGSVVNLTDPAGDPTAVYAYDAWGAPEGPGHAATDQNRFRFTGEEREPQTGLYYLRARWYDPSVGRFLNKDPFWGFAYYPQSLNGFMYAFGNPLKWVDPGGRGPIGVSDRFLDNLAQRGLNFLGQRLDEFLIRQVSGIHAMHSISSPETIGRTFGRVSASVTPIMNIVVQPAINAYADNLVHPERDPVEKAARYTIDVTAGTILTLGSWLVSPAYGVGAGAVYDTMREPIQDAILYNPVTDIIGEALYNGLSESKVGGFWGKVGRRLGIH